jgi:hypothetical protein
MPFPKTLDQLREQCYLPDGFSTCSCGAKIKWYRTPKGKRMPMIVFEDGSVEPHWSDCPDAQKYRRENRGQ